MNSIVYKYKKTLISILSLLLFSLEVSAQSRILIIGDSLTAGYGVGKESAFPMQLQELLRKTHPKITVVAAGSSGATTAGAESRLRWHLKNKPDVLVLALGANDGLRGLPVESTKDNLAKAIDLAQKNKVTVLLAGMKMPMNYGEEYRLKYEKIFSELAEEKNVKLIPFLLEGVGGEKDMNLADGIHPNEKGHRQIADHLHQYIKESL
jgi:acyl-CoA thioesterase I